MNGNEHATRTSGTTDRSLTEEVEVAVVGAGPTGLTLAVMLSGYGIRTAVLDGAAGPARHSRAAVVHARTLETLEPLGVVGEMLGGGVVVPHFGVRDRDRLLLGVDFDGLPTTHPYTLMLPQDRTERILLGALHEQGGRVLWEHEAVGLSQDEGGVELVVRGARGEGRARAPLSPAWARSLRRALREETSAVSDMAKRPLRRGSATMIAIWKARLIILGCVHSPDETLATPGSGKRRRQERPRN